MKKQIVLLLVALAILGMPLAAAAAELTACTVAALDAAGTPGGMVTVEVRMTDNPGFTNLAVSLQYDRDHLTLKSIDAASLSANVVSSNLQWEASDTYGYVVTASADPVKDDGTLFTATFEIAEGYVGDTEVTPVVHYIRNNEAVFSIFQEIQAQILSGNITVLMSGDVNGDGIVEYDDVMLAYKAFLGQETLTEQQLAVVDQNGNDSVEETEYQSVYQSYIGG